MSLSLSPSSCHVLASNCQNNMQGQSSMAPRKYVHTVHSVNTHLAVCTPHQLCYAVSSTWNMSMTFYRQCGSWRTRSSSSNTASDAAFLYLWQFYSLINVYFCLWTLWFTPLPAPDTRVNLCFYLINVRFNLSGENFFNSSGKQKVNWSVFTAQNVISSDSFIKYLNKIRTLVQICHNWSVLEEIFSYFMEVKVAIVG